MDAGLAAVLGALAGSMATIGAALATGWSQREGARILARSEHRRQRQEPRNGAYKDFISAASRMRDLVDLFTLTFNDGDFPYSRINAYLSSHCKEAANTIKEKWVDVALAGPKEITEAASLLERLSNALAFRVEALRRLVETTDGPTDTSHAGIKNRITQEAIEFEENLERFMLLAQAALDDDGSRK
ncbi:hypothetical protein [Streptomyces pristinaespiralis]|uniref:hypothetical protein n=1 Tax=Streptomyces pristinaespiralis TaxID=38300 RepID=UPI003836CFAE